MASAEIVRKVLAHNPDCVWVLARKRKFNPAQPVGEGFIAMLPLNGQGAAPAWRQRASTAPSPTLALVAKPGEKPAGLYMWATYAPGILAGGISLFMKEIASGTVCGVNLIRRPNTPGGASL